MTSELLWVQSKLINNILESLQCNMKSEKNIPVNNNVVNSKANFNFC